MDILEIVLISNGEGDVREIFTVSEFGQIFWKSSESSQKYKRPVHLYIDILKYTRHFCNVLSFVIISNSYPVYWFFSSSLEIACHRLQSCHVCTFICINFVQKVCGIVGLFSKFSYEIQHNLVELFGAKLVWL